MDTFATALYVKIDDELVTNPLLRIWRPAVGIAPQLSDAELLTMAVIQALLGFTSTGTQPLSKRSSTSGRPVRRAIGSSGSQPPRTMVASEAMAAAVAAWARSRLSDRTI